MGLGAAVSVNRFFTSDLHLGHTNILKYDPRPFATIEEHDETLIQNWNSIVKPQDRVYLLGDVTWYLRKEKIIETLNRLHGRIYLIRGNHDKLMDRPGIRERFNIRENLMILKFKGEGIVRPGGTLHVSLCHYAMRRWLNSHRPDSWCLHGHSHGNLEDKGGLIMDVGTMLSQFHPIPWEVIVKVMKKRIERGLGPSFHHERR
jgi:calcineurin-like phosphoesterase family protein